TDRNRNAQPQRLSWLGLRVFVAYPDARPGPQARHVPHSPLGVLRTVLPLTARFSLIYPPGLGAGGNHMDCEMKPFRKPKQVPVPPQRRPNTQAMTPHIKMFVSDWFIDEQGNRLRLIKARD